MQLRGRGLNTLGTNNGSSGDLSVVNVIQHWPRTPRKGKLLLLLIFGKLVYRCLLLQYSLNALMLPKCKYAPFFHAADSEQFIASMHSDFSLLASRARRVR